MSLTPIDRTMSDPNNDIGILRAERDRAQSMCTTWHHVFGDIEAHLMDRVHMKDDASPATYLSIIRASIGHIERDSEAICRSRWADLKRYADRGSEDERMITDLLAALISLLAILGGDMSALPECDAARAAIARVRGEGL